MQQGHALPWAAAPDSAAGADAAAVRTAQPEEAVEPDLPSSSGMAVGSVLEVKWVLHDDEKGTHTFKWWPATLAKKAEGQADGEGRQVYVLRYAADPDAGHDEETENQVTFVDQHRLYDLGEDEDLPWRQTGEEWDTEGSEDEQAAVTEGDEADHVTVALDDVVREIVRRERRRGRSVEEECQALLSALPPERQREVAEGFRTLTDSLVQGISSLCERNGAGYVVQASDVEAIFSAVKRQRMGRSPSPPPGML